MPVHTGLSLMLDDAYRIAVIPLFEEGLVDALEWSFDQAWGAREVPGWIPPLLDHYAAAGRLWGHGVTYSAGSADPGTRHDAWLERLAHEIALRPLRGISEHLGFMLAGERIAGAPLPMPDGPGARAVLATNLARIAAVASVPVGIENLALALGPDEPWQQGPMIADVLEATNGYLVLDLHNLWCQLANYELDADTVLATYPLDRVRCIHVSGGSWWPVADGGRFRRDTHDAGVPDEVLSLLDRCLPRCPALEVVVVERIGEMLDQPGEAERLRSDFLAVRARVAAAEAAEAAHTSSRTPAVAHQQSHTSSRTPPVAHRQSHTSSRTMDEARLGAWQTALVDALLENTDDDDVRARLRLAAPWADPRIARLDVRALAVARVLVRRWSPHVRDDCPA